MIAEKENPMKFRSLIGVASGLAIAVATAFPALAVPTGDLITVNPTGGQTTSDGLKLEIAFGQIQIGRNGSGQMYSDEDIPDPTNSEVMSNYFVVAVNDGTNTTLIGSTENSSGTPASLLDSLAWDSFTSESALTDSDRSGTVTNHLVYGSGATEVKLDVTWTYTYPNQYFNVKADLTLGSAYAGQSHRIYWFTDSYLEGSDEGNQFGGITPAGKEVAGVVSLPGTQIEAFRQVSGQSLKWYAGEYECPYTDYDAENCGVEVAEGGFLGNFLDFPNVSAPGTNIDNGFGVNSPVSTAATESITFDLLFASCLDGVSPLPCADEATGDDKNLPNTGSDATAMGISAAVIVALIALGLAMTAIRRRRSA